MTSWLHFGTRGPSIRLVDPKEIIIVLLWPTWSAIRSAPAAISDPREVFLQNFALKTWTKIWNFCSRFATDISPAKIKKFPKISKFPKIFEIFKRTFWDFATVFFSPKNPNFLENLKILRTFLDLRKFWDFATFFSPKNLKIKKLDLRKFWDLRNF